jgi:N12 class adenine-specific DNA methylase
MRVMRELAKLNPQGQVHAQELYAAVNVIRRSPPGVILYQMIHNPQINHLGDLYFRISEKE